MLSSAAAVRKVTLVPGDGVGPELCQHVKDVVKHTGAPIEFEEFWFSECNPINSASVEQLTASFNANKVGLKGKDFTGFLGIEDDAPQQGILFYSLHQIWYRFKIW